MTYALYIRDDLYQAGYGEDGEPAIGSLFYLMFETPDGRRFSHDYAVRDLELIAVTDDEGNSYSGWHRIPNVTRRLEALQDQVERHLKAGGKLDDNHWHEGDPAYGSTAYQTLDAQGYFLAAERQRDRERGENVPEDYRLDSGIEAELPELSLADLPAGRLLSTRRQG